MLSVFVDGKLTTRSSVSYDYGIDLYPLVTEGGLLQVALICFAITKKNRNDL